MSEELIRLRRRKQARKRLQELFSDAKHTFIIHYSCESFYDTENGRTPRVTSIAVRNLASGQTESFSIHKQAELKSIPISEIAEKYDDLEKKMLDEFFEFARVHQHDNWIHWNMRDINYGFAAIEHRYRVLGGSPTAVTEEKRFDLARALVDLYSRRYIGHRRLEKLVEKNGITNMDFLTGEEEAKAFTSKDFIKLHRSTLRKVDILANVFERALERTLLTNATWADQYGFHPKVVLEVVKEHWIWTLVAMIATVVGVVRAFAGAF